MGEAAAERAADADRVMRDVADHAGQQGAERPRDHRTMERRVPHAGADGERIAGDRQAVERADRVDVDQVRRPRQAERHGRHQALAARQDAPVVGGELFEQRDRLGDRDRRVIDERRGLHRPLIPPDAAAKFVCMLTILLRRRQRGARPKRHRSRHATMARRLAPSCPNTRM